MRLRPRHPSAGNRPLPWPASALRDRLRGIAEAVGETRSTVLAARAETAAGIGVLDERLRAQEAHAAAVGGHLAAVDRHVAALEARLGELAHQTDATGESLTAGIAGVMSGLRVVADAEPRQRQRLWELREDPDYDGAFTDDEPLVSIVIPTFDNYRLLCERAIPSALGQTYERIEVVVVGDGAPEAAQQAIEGLGDPRVTFHNLPYRGPYPEDPHRRWLVAGVPPYNEAVRRASGRWIAPLDDDDALHPDHVEVLLRHAREQRAELVYGLIREHSPDGAIRQLGRFPPELGQFGLQASIYHAGLAQVFDLELADAEWGDPYDWGLCRRMLRAGVRVAMVPEEVVHYYPSQRWNGEAVTNGDRPAPEWEIATEGWDASRSSERESGQGWDVEAVARAYARKWPDFLRVIDGPGPLGVAHEVPDGAEMRRNDVVAHNTVISFGYVLARAARRKDSLSVLDWGGALGHYHELARRLIDDVSFDFHCRELPAVCEQGRALTPGVQFHETDACLDRSYDLVMSSATLQYADDWAATLRSLAHAADPWLYVARLPVARRHATFVVRQRAHAFGYGTEYVGWVVNRDELVAAADDAGLELVREFVLLGPMPVAGAAEDPEHIALLFRRREEK